MYRRFCIALLVFGLCAFGQLSAQEFVTDGLVSFWTFDNSSINGNIAADSWGNNDGEMTDTQIVAGKINEGLEFNGSTSMVSAPNDPSFDIFDGITLEAWIKLRVWAVSDRHSIMTRYDAGATKRYAQFAVRPGNSLSVFLGHSDGTAYIEGSMNVESPEWEGEWVHVVASWSMSDGGLPKLYVNGTEVAEYSVQTAWEDTLATNNDLPWTIGAYPGLDRYLDGVMDEVRIYNRRLSDAEIATNYSVQSNAVAAVRPAGKLTTTWAAIRSQ
jgi:hypothetical protein